MHDNGIFANESLHILQVTFSRASANSRPVVHSPARKLYFKPMLKLETLGIKPMTMNVLFSRKSKHPIVVFDGHVAQFVPCRADK
jgi:hypothetical protein